MVRVIVCFVLTGVTILPFHAHGEAEDSDFQISVAHYSVENGLSSREVFCAVQDNDGFIWLGTRNGLCRYDGKSFKVFTKQSHGLFENRVIQIVKDFAGRLILVYGHPNQIRATMKIEVFDPKSFYLTSFSKAYPEWKIKEDNIAWIAYDGDGIAILKNNPIRYLHFGKTKNKEINLNSFLTEPDWLSNEPNTSGARITSFGHHCQFYKRSVIFAHNPAIALVGDSIFQLGYDIKLRQFTADGSLIVRDKAKKYVKIGVDSKWEPCYPGLTEEETQAIVHGNSHEIFVFDDKNGIRLLTGEVVIPILAASKTHFSSWSGIYNYFRDNTGAYWICTSGGLYRILIQKKRFRNFFTKSQLNITGDNQARGIAIDSQSNLIANLWTGTYQTNLRSTTGHIIARKHESIQYGLAFSNGKIISAGYYLSVFKPGSLQPLKSLSLSDFNEIWTIYPRDDTTIFFGAKKIQQIYNPQTDEVKSIGKKYDNLLYPFTVYRFLPKSTTELWIIAQNGIFILSLKDYKIIDCYFSHSKDSSRRLPFETIHDACITGKFMWVATNGEGLFRWDMSSNTFKQFMKKDGLPSDILYRLEQDDFNHLWISTDNGLARMNLTDFNLNIFTDKDGLPHNEFNRASSYKSSSGKIYFGGLNGVTELDPRDFLGERKKTSDPLRIISVNQFSASTGKLEDMTQDWFDEGKIVLNPGDKFFTIEFRLLDFNEGTLSYAYHLEGLDRDWIELSEPNIRINGLAPGNYKLLIKGRNSEGTWSDDVLSIPVLVMAPIWRQPWFITLILALIFTSVYILFKWRTRQLELAKSALERTVENRTQQLKVLLEQKELMMKEIHHRVKNNLQVISSLLRLQQERTSDETTQRALQESQNRVLSIAFLHQNLYQHDDMKGVYMKEFIPELCRHIQSVYEADTRNIQIDFRVDNILLHIDAAVPLGLIINELLTNSFKYAFQDSKEGQISIQLTDKGNDQYSFQYRDSGPGLPQGADWKKSPSLGLKLVHQLSRQLGGAMQYLNDHGVVFHLEFSTRETD